MQHLGKGLWCWKPQQLWNWPQWIAHHPLSPLGINNSPASPGLALVVVGLTVSCFHIHILTCPCHSEWGGVVDHSICWPLTHAFPTEPGRVREGRGCTPGYYLKAETEEYPDISLLYSMEKLSPCVRIYQVNSIPQSSLIPGTHRYLTYHVPKLQLYIHWGWRRSPVLKSLLSPVRLLDHTNLQWSSDTPLRRSCEQASHHELQAVWWIKIIQCLHSCLPRILNS